MGRGSLALACGLLVLFAAGAAGARGAAAAGVSAVEATGAPEAHDLHLVYGDFAVEGSIIAGRIRFFKDDLERALGPLVGAASVTLEPGAEADALVTRYVREKLRIIVDGNELEASLLQSGEDDLDREPMWWVIVQYRAPSPPDPIHVRNTLFFELFDDQRNIFKFVRFPDETQRTFYFAEGESEHIVRF